MARVKLSEWCKQNNIAYITAYRWFKDDKFPVPAIQTESGTILVDVPETNTDKDVSLFVQKTIEFSNSNASISDFAAYVLNNFSLKANPGSMTTECVPMSYNVMPSTASSPNFDSSYFSATPVTFSSNLVPSENISLNYVSSTIPNTTLAETGTTTYNSETAVKEENLITKNKKKNKKESK